MWCNLYISIIVCSCDRWTRTEDLKTLRGGIWLHLRSVKGSTSRIRTTGTTFELWPEKYGVKGMATLGIWLHPRSIEGFTLRVRTITVVWSIKLLRLVPNTHVISRDFSWSSRQKKKGNLNECWKFRVDLLCKLVKLSIRREIEIDMQWNKVISPGLNINYNWIRTHVTPPFIPGKKRG